MKIEVNEDMAIVLKEVFSGVLMEQPDGNQLGICMRDDTFEINVCPKGEDKKWWFRVDFKEGKVFYQGIYDGKDHGLVEGPLVTRLENFEVHMAVDPASIVGINTNNA